MKKNPVASGKSSFDLINREKFISLLEIESDTKIVDLACGAGKYSIEIANLIGDKGTVYAVDLWEDGINILKDNLKELNIKNIEASVADIREKISFAENMVDGCLLSTIVHDLSKNEQEKVFNEVYRFLKPKGILYIIEFKKIGVGPGPPIGIRMSEEEIESAVCPHGFIPKYIGSIGEFNYMMKFVKN